MKILAQFNFFFQKHLEHSFTANDTAVYMHLLQICNSLGRKNPFNYAKDRLQADLGFRTEDPLLTARKRLREAGLIEFENGNGRGKTTLYTLHLAPVAFELSDEERGVKNDPLSGEANAESQEERGGERGRNNTPLSPALSDKRGGERGVKNTPYTRGTTIEKRRDNKEAATAAVFDSDSGKKSTPKRPAKTGLDHEAVAGLPLPENFGPAFADLWRTFYTENTHQQKKPVGSLEKLLARLGKWPEGAAIQVLEAAIESNWSGFAHDGAARIVENWKTQQAKAPAPSPATAEPEELNLEVIAEQQAARNAQRETKRAKYVTAAA